MLAELTLQEKATLMAGANMWATVAVERVGLPSIKVSDGPGGVRGGFAPGESPFSAVSIPCGSALGATWNPSLIAEVGAMLGAEARTKTARVLLAPTVNLHRSPLAGRNFECYSEDPLLTGEIAVAFIEGVQSQGVATTIKHFAANDQEHERYTTSSEVDERTLRELYLVPFEMAVKRAHTLGIMTGYNRINGMWCSENSWLLETVLRGEWGYDGFVISDWFAIGSTVASAVAGLDLEMPGPGRHTLGIVDAVLSGALDEAVVTERVRKQLQVWERLEALEDPISPLPESAVDLPEHRALTRRCAAEAIVLLTNRDGALPLDRTAVQSIAVVGPNARTPQIGGGGSAELLAHYRSNVVDALGGLLGADCSVTHAQGCDISRTVTPVEMALEASYHVGNEFDFTGTPALTKTLTSAEVFAFGALRGVGDDFSMVAEGEYVAEQSGPHVLRAVQGGRARVWFDGELVIDGVTNPPGAGGEFFGLVSDEMRVARDLVAGRSYRVRVEYSSAHSTLLHIFKFGIASSDHAALIEEAVAVAAAAEVAVVVVGTNSQWETEGHDRSSMDLPGNQHELIRRVCAVNPRTIVVVNTGSPVTMDWADLPVAVLQSWFGGQEMGNAIADVLFGVLEPGGRLPTTIPLRVEHNPSYTNFGGDNRLVRYGEGVFIGYRWYETRVLPVRFAFGHGLSYTTFSLGSPSVVVDGATAVVSIDVTNTGTRQGSQVVQCYVAPSSPRLTRPVQELKAFAKVTLHPGDTQTITLHLDARSFAYWDSAEPNWAAIHDKLRATNPMSPLADNVRTEPGWYVDAGTYTLNIGTASNNIAHATSITIDKSQALPR